MKRKNVAIVKGMSVRVARADYHNAVFGAIGVVEQVDSRSGDALVHVACKFPWNPDVITDQQYIELIHLKPVKAKE